jgi:hypothetical protein
MNRICIRLVAAGAGVGLSEKILQRIATDDQTTLVADNQIIALKLDEEFGYPRTRSAHQVGKVLMSCRYGQTGSVATLKTVTEEVPSGTGRRGFRQPD